MPVIKALRTCAAGLIATNGYMSNTIHDVRARAYYARTRVLLLGRYPSGLIGADEIDAILSLYYRHQIPGRASGQSVEDLPE